jgi:hypothetical protein
LPLLFYPRSSANLVHHAYQVATLERALTIRVDAFRTVFEFGGGYGSLARMFGRLGFKGKYYLVDLPEMIALQGFFFSSIASEESLPEVESVFAGEAFQVPIEDPSLFIALWSLSETPLETRTQWLPMMRRFTAVLIGYQSRHEDLDNREWVETLTGADSGFTWVHREFPSLPGNGYLIGLRGESAFGRPRP